MSLYSGPFLESCSLFMAGLYRHRHPERTVFYRVLFHYFEKFLSGYESRFEREYGFLRPVVQEVTVCHHEACKAVVISLCIALDRMRLPRRFAPRNDVSTAAIRSVDLRGFGVETVGPRGS